MMMCPLCKCDSDSHDHLFFQCSYARQFWNKVNQKIGMGCIETDWKNIVSNMTLLYNGSSIDSIIRRLGLAASVYLIWQERNLRLIKEESRDVEILFEELCEVMRLRLSSLKVKNSEAVLRAQKNWNISMDICDGEAV